MTAANANVAPKNAKTLTINSTLQLQPASLDISDKNIA